MNLPADIEKARRDIERYAREFGLDFYDVVFELLDYDQLNEVAAFGGFPTRYPHWRFGMEYEELSKSYSYGLSKIYELVINNNPVYAYLMKANAPVEQKLVMAHVFGHADFFKNNLWFSKTNRRMIDAMANHATRVRHHVDRHGVEPVEDFIDACLSLENLIDYHSDFIERQEKKEHRPLGAPAEDEAPAVRRLKSKSYMEPYINPPQAMEQERARAEEKARGRRAFPEKPRRDVLHFLLEHAPLQPWEHDVLSIVREEAQYFAPQGMTKVLNEGWACVTGDTLVFTDRGLMPMASVVKGEALAVSDGGTTREVVDRHLATDRETITVCTRRGLRLCGSANHRVLGADGRTWHRLDQLVTGEHVTVSGGLGLWAKTRVAIAWRPRSRLNVFEAAAAAGLANVSTVYRHRAGRNVRDQAGVAAALDLYESLENRTASVQTRKRKAIRVPSIVDEEMASFLGYLLGDGHLSRVKRQVGLTTGDADQAEAFSSLAGSLFGLQARLRLDGTRWRVALYSEALSDFLQDAFEIPSGPSARRKHVPAAVLRSPAPVVAAFLRSYFDCDGYAGSAGVVLSTSSERMSVEVQVLLLNFGILSRRRLQKDGCWQVQVRGRSAQSFREHVGFGLERKRRALSEYIDGHQWFHEESWTDKVVSVAPGRADVYDVSVAETHRYAAAGFVNHNSYWHSTIMTQRALNDSEVVDFADQHAGTMAMSPGRFNPYKIGIELFREIEDRWNKGRFGKEYDECDDLAAKRRWDRRLGLGRQKIFEVRKVYNDVMFVDAFLNEDFCERLKLYTYGYDSRSGQYVLLDRDWRKVKQRLLFSLTNLGQPIVQVVDANYANRGELYLIHRFEGVPLDVEKARDTLRNLHRLWRRPVHLETAEEDDRGRLLSYDGSEHKSSRL